VFCFIENMETGSVNNINSHMQNQPLNVGVIVPPDAHYKPVLYSDAQATTQFNYLNRDIYQGVKKSKNINEKKTPLMVKILLAIGAVALSFPLVKKVFSR